MRAGALHAAAVVALVCLQLHGAAARGVIIWPPLIIFLLGAARTDTTCSSVIGRWRSQGFAEFCCSRLRGADFICYDDKKMMADCSGRDSSSVAVLGKE